MYTIIGVIVGLLLRYMVIKPFERKKIRAECAREGLVPSDFIKKY